MEEDKNNFDDVLKELNEKVIRVLDLNAMDLQNEWQDVVSKPGTGNKYSNLRYRSAAIGQPPTVQTGKLKASIQIDRSNIDQWEIEVGTNLDYAKYLQRNGHPHVDEALKKVEDRVQKRFESLQ